MPAPLQSFHYHVGEDAGLAPEEASRPAESFRAERPSGIDTEGAALSFNSNEAAARYYLDQLLQGDNRPAMRAVGRARATGAHAGPGRRE